MSMRFLLMSGISFLSIQIFSPAAVQAVVLTAAQAQPGSFVMELGSPAGQSQLSPEQRLKESAKLAKKGEHQQAFEMARGAKNLQSPNPLFSVDYLNTLLTINKKADAESRTQILDEAVATVEALKNSSSYDGRNNPESAYYFMLAVGEVADAILALNEDTYFNLSVCQGNIARNLRTNPSYPADGKESLAEPLIGMAKGLALKGDQPAALQAITEASEVGFGRFDELTEDPAIKSLGDQAAVKTHLATLKKSYLVKLEKWSQQEIENFDSFGFEFEVDDVEGGKVDNEEFDDKILVVDFWATWCAPCREGIPHFVKLQKEFADEDVQVLGVSMDSPEDPQSSAGVVKNFLKKNKVNYPCGLGTDQLTQRLPGDVKLPTTVFMDRMGNVRYIANGYHDHGKLAAITKTLMNEPQPVRTTLKNVKSRLLPH